MAVGAVKYAAARGLRIPEDLNTVGYNNSSLAVACEPELTSIDNRTEEICKETVDLFMRTLRGEDVPEKHFSVSCRIVKRSTTDF